MAKRILAPSSSGCSYSRFSGSSGRPGRWPPSSRSPCSRSGSSTSSWPPRATRRSQRLGLLFGGLITLAPWTEARLEPARASARRRWRRSCSRSGCSRERTPEKRVEALASTLFGLVYVSLLLQYLVRIVTPLAGDAIPPDGRLVLCLWVVAVAKFCDVGALLTGLAIGRHAMAPADQPEEDLGGRRRRHRRRDGRGRPGGLARARRASRDAWARCARRSSPRRLAAVAIVSDLVESAIKRRAALKDSGGGVPGIGGIFDLSDSLILAAPGRRISSSACPRGRAAILPDRGRIAPTHPGIAPPQARRPAGRDRLHRGERAPRASPPTGTASSSSGSRRGPTGGGSRRSPANSRSPTSRSPTRRPARRRRGAGAFAPGTRLLQGAGGPRGARGPARGRPRPRRRRRDSGARAGPGGDRGGQGPGPRLEGDPRPRGQVRDGGGEAARDADPAGRQRAQRRLPVHRGPPELERQADHPDRERRRVPGLARGEAPARDPGGRPEAPQLGTWGRRSPWTRATLANKGLELIEAQWLFGLQAGPVHRGHPPAEHRPLPGRVQRRRDARPAFARRR